MAVMGLSQQVCNRLLSLASPSGRTGHGQTPETSLFLCGVGGPLAARVWFNSKPLFLFKVVFGERVYCIAKRYSDFSNIHAVGAACSIASGRAD